MRRGALLLAAVVVVPACDVTFTGDDSSGSAGSAFNLLLPLNGATAVLINPQLAWNAVPGAKSYRLQIATSPSFAAPIWDEAGILLPTMFLNPSLTYSSTYHWRVYAVQGLSQTLLGGSPFRFTTVGTGGAAPADFGLVLPPSGASGVSTVPRFEWELSVAAMEYVLQVSTVNDFSSFVVNQAGIKINQIACPVALSPATTYYWRVIAQSSGGTRTSLASPRSFRT